MKSNLKATCLTQLSLTVQAVRKDVTTKLYGDDVTIKKKLLEKQKVEKKKMKVIGNFELPATAFRAVLKIDDAN